MLFTCRSRQGYKLCQKKQTYFFFSWEEKANKEILVRGMQGLPCDKRNKKEQQEGQTATTGNLNLRHFDNPTTDDERLLNYQYDYLVNHSETAWANLWQLSTDVAGRMLANICKKRRLKLSSFDWEDKRSEAVTYVLRRYKTRKGYYIEKDFPLQIWYGVKHVLDYRTKGEILIDNVLKNLNEGGFNLDV